MISPFAGAYISRTMVSNCARRRVILVWFILSRFRATILAVSGNFLSLHNNVIGLNHTCTHIQSVPTSSRISESRCGSRITMTHHCRWTVCTPIRYERRIPDVRMRVLGPRLADKNERFLLCGRCRLLISVQPYHHRAPVPIRKIELCGLATHVAPKPCSALSRRGACICHLVMWIQ